MCCISTFAAPLEVMLSHDGHVIRAGSLPEGSIEREVVLTHYVMEEGYYQCLARNDYGCEQWTTLATFTPSLPTSECVMINVPYGRKFSMEGCLVVMFIPVKVFPVNICALLAATINKSIPIHVP